MSAPSSHETEIKLRISSAAEFQQRLPALGFLIAKPRVFEANTVFDTPGGDLRKSQCLLRVRQAGERNTMTFKGVANPGKHKSREELEIAVSDAATLSKILAKLEYQPVFRYEKYRTEWERPGVEGTVTVDETPIGAFAELEGSPEWIDQTAAELGFKENEYLTGSYFTLYRDDRVKHGLPIGNMVFRGCRPA